MNVREGQALALRLRKGLLVHRRAGACPPPGLGRANDREGQALALRYWGVSLLSHVREGQALALPLCRLRSPDRNRVGIRRSRTTEVGPVPVGRGPVPRRAWDERTFARDRPSRYGYREGAFARDRPSRYGYRKERLSLSP